MKRILSTALSALMLLPAAVSCAPAEDRIDPAITTVSSDAAIYAEWLDERLDTIPDDVVIGIGSNEAYGIDMSDFESDGYILRELNGDVLIFGAAADGTDRAVRAYAKAADIGQTANLDEVYHEGDRVKKLTVAGHDISEYAIVRDDDADECQTFAASELVTYIEKTCSAILPSYTASEYAAAPDKPARTITLTVDYPALGDESFAVEIGEDGNMVISGGRYRGCMYGVYDVLEDMGWRFLNDAVDTKTSYIEYLYESEHVDLTSALNRTESPAIAYRRIYGGMGFVTNDANLSITNDLNSGITQKYKTNYSDSAKFGSYGLTGVAIHGLDVYHNEIFSGEYEGYYYGYKQTGRQPCFTDDIILSAIDEFALRYVETRLAAGQEIGRELVTLDLSQWDSGADAFCLCSNCAKVMKEDRCTMGAVLRMGNRVASLFAENGYEDMNVSLLAYNGTNKPPKKTVPLDNVRISYCIYVAKDYITCNAHTVTGEDCVNGWYSNETIGEELEGWAAICNNNNLDIWYYPFNCYGVAFDSPLYDTLYDDMIYLTNSSVNGMMFHSNYSSGANLHSLISYVGAKLMWDNSITREEYYELIREWFTIVYGDAGENLFEYFNMVEKADDTAGCWCAFHSSNTDKIDTDYMAENFDYMYSLFDEARDLADSTHQEQMVERYMSGMLYMGIGITHTDRYLNGTDEERAVIADRYTELHRMFREYDLRVYWDFIQEEYAPEILDLDSNPFDSWCLAWGN